MTDSTNFDRCQRLARLKLNKIEPFYLRGPCLRILEVICDSQIKLEKLFCSEKCEEIVINAICKQKSITHLELPEVKTNQNLVRLVKNLKNLAYIDASCETLEGIHNALIGARYLKEARFHVNSDKLAEEQNLSSILDGIETIRCKRHLQLTVYIKQVSISVFLQMIKDSTFGWTLS